MGLLILNMPGLAENARQMPGQLIEYGRDNNTY